MTEVSRVSVPGIWGVVRARKLPKIKLKISPMDKSERAVLLQGQRALLAYLGALKVA